MFILHLSLISLTQLNYLNTSSKCKISYMNLKLSGNIGKTFYLFWWLSSIPMIALRVGEALRAYQGEVENPRRFEK